MRNKLPVAAMTVAGITLGVNRMRISKVDKTFVLLMGAAKQQVGRYQRPELAVRPSHLSFRDQTTQTRHSVWNFPPIRLRNEFVARLILL